MPANKISLPVIKRLPRYYRYVADLQKQGVKTISSSELAAMLGTTASQVRQDFNCFGGFGQQGIGYTVDVLETELKKLLLGGKELDIILVGAGRLGRTIAHFLAQDALGYNLAAAFDNSPDKIGQMMSGTVIRDAAGLVAYCRENNPSVAAICVPDAGAAVLAPMLAEGGIKGIWNFSHFDYRLTNPDIILENVHLSDSLMSLGFRVRKNGADQ